MNIANKKTNLMLFSVYVTKVCLSEVVIASQPATLKKQPGSAREAHSRNPYPQTNTHHGADQE